MKYKVEFIGFNQYHLSLLLISFMAVGLSPGKLVSTTIYQIYQSNQTSPTCDYRVWHFEESNQIFTKEHLLQGNK